MPVSALELYGATTLSARHSNNTLRSEDDRLNNFSLEPGLLLDMVHEGNNLNAVLDYQFERRFHTEERNSERNFFSGGARVNWTLLPDRLEINLNQNSTESTRVGSQRGAPNDTDVTDNLSVGPTLFFRVRDTDRLNFTYLYEDRNAILDEDDSRSDVLSGSYLFQFTEFSSFTLEHREEDIKFSSDLARDIDVTNQTLTYNYRNSGVNFTLGGGHSEYERDGAEPIDGAIGDMRFYRSSGPTSFTVYARRNITNQSFRLFEQLDEINFDDFTLFLDANIAEVFTETAYGIQYTQQVGATLLRFGLDFFQYDYEETLRGDRDEYVVNFGATRRINRAMTLTAGARYRVQDTDDIEATPLAPAEEGEEFKLVTLRSQLTWNVASRLNIGVGIEYNNTPGGFNETEAFITATFGRFRRQQLNSNRQR